MLAARQKRTAAPFLNALKRRENASNIGRSGGSSHGAKSLGILRFFQQQQQDGATTEKTTIPSLSNNGISKHNDDSKNVRLDDESMNNSMSEGDFNLRSSLQRSIDPNPHQQVRNNETLSKVGLHKTDEKLSPRIIPPAMEKAVSLNVYTDGSCVNNGKKGAVGGIGVYFGSVDDERNISECVPLGDPVNGKVTNQSAELLACIRAIERGIFRDSPPPTMSQLHHQTKTKSNAHLFLGVVMTIYTDSEYVVKSMNSWASAWSKNGWKTRHGQPIANIGYMKRLFELKKTTGTRFQHVPAHQAEPRDKNSIAHAHWEGNRRADELATSASARYNCQRRNV